MEDYRLPAPLVGMLRAANLTGKPAVQTDLQPTKLAVTITWDLATSAPKKPKYRRSTKTAKPEPANRRQPATSSTSSVQQPPTTNQPALRQTAPPPTVTIISPTAPTLNYQRPETTRPSPTMLPPKKLPRHEPPAQTTTDKDNPAPPTTSDQPEPMTTDQPKPKRLHQSRQTSMKVGSRYDIDAIRQLGKGANRRLICLLRYRLAPNQRPRHQECYGLYLESEHNMIMHVSSDCHPGDHHAFYWKGRKAEFNKGSPVTDAAAEIDKLKDAWLKYVLPLDQ